VIEAKKKVKIRGWSFTCNVGTPRLWTEYKDMGIVAEQQADILWHTVTRITYGCFSKTCIGFINLERPSTASNPIAWSVRSMENVPRYGSWGSCKAHKPLMPISNMCFSRLTQPFACPCRLRLSRVSRTFLPLFLHTHLVYECAIEVLNTLLLSPTLFRSSYSYRSAGLYSLPLSWIESRR